MNRLASWWVAALTVLTFTPTAFAQWSTDPANNLIVGYGLLPELCSDSAGGCYITYEDNTTYPRHLILHRLNRYGYKPWGSSGKRLTGLLPQQFSAKLCEDGRGGVIVSYVDLYTNNSETNPVFIGRVRVQRIDSSGNFLWSTNGVRVSISETNQSEQVIVGDGQGGCIVAYKDTMNSLRIQRIDFMGNRAWIDSGIFVANIGYGNAVMDLDNAGGTIITWGYLIFKRYNSFGQNVWPDTGITIQTGGTKLVSTMDGRTYLLGVKNIGYQNGKLVSTINLQRIDTSGNVDFGNDGIVIDTIRTNRFLRQAIAISGTHEFLSWTTEISDSLDDKYQIIDSEGHNILATGGQAISRVHCQKSNSTVIQSGSNNAILLWSDNRNGNWSLYSQRRDTMGAAVWSDSDVAISVRNVPGDYRVTTDSRGGAIVCWYETPSFAILVQQVGSHGRLGEVVTSIENEGLPALPAEYVLHQNFPNPFNSETVIKYDLPRSSEIVVAVHDLVGRQIETLVSGPAQAGTHQVTLNGSKLCSGVYFYTLRTERVTITHKFTILK